jgi:transcriptional regulator GlxA family with amidase domain
MKKIITLLVLGLLLFSYSYASGEKAALKVGILIYEGVYLLDFCGPLEIFNDTFLEDGSQGFEVFLVAVADTAVRAHTGTLVKPDYSFSNCPQTDILVVPGGNLRLSTEVPAVADFIKAYSSKSKLTMSVCTGAFILASLGMLDGMEATTWYGAKERLGKLYPRINLSDERFTDNGSIVTTAGISAGIDGALHIVEKIYGKAIADKTAKYIEWESAGGK